MRRLALVLVSASLAVFLSGSAMAWEFSMKGEWEWRYRYWTRMGQNDIFGTMDSTNVNLGMNHLYLFPTSGATNRMADNFGVLAGQNNFGSDMSMTDNRATIYPKINVNKAISLEGSVNLTSLGTWSDGEPYGIRTATATNGSYSNRGFYNSMYVPINDRPVASNVPNTFVTIQWLKASIRTPMLDFSLGYKTSAIGMGLWKHNDNRSSSSFGVSANYGPFKIGFSPYFGREQSAWSLGEATSRNTGAGGAQRQEDRRDYFKAVMGELSYRNGPMELQLVSDSYHQPNAPAVSNNNAAGALGVPFRGGSIVAGRPSEDILRYRIALAAKYNDGRFFFNGEADWFNRWRSGRGAADPSNVNGTDFRVRENRDNEAWLYGAEIGALTGPAKITLNYVRATGDDTSTRHTTEDAADSEQGLSAPYMKPWGYLMYYMYGTGDGWDASGQGQPTNFHHLGARIDYAVAANLNLFVVYSYAWRDQAVAYRLGGDWRYQAQRWTNDDIRLSQNGTYRGQAVPESAGDIGWEVDFGHDWKLLEGLTWGATFAIWKPGNWWSYAYPNTAYMYRQTAGAALTANETNATFNLGREIAPLFSAETRLNINF